MTGRARVAAVSRRASVAASFLQAAGYAVTVVDDDFGRAAAAGLPVTGDVVPLGAAPPESSARGAASPGTPPPLPVAS